MASQCLPREQRLVFMAVEGTLLLLKKKCKHQPKSKAFIYNGDVTFLYDALAQWWHRARGSKQKISDWI